MFKLGDKVSWESQASGWTKIKYGVIVEVVRSGCWPKLPIKDIGGSRNRESYIVLVGRKYYWPRVKNLRMANVLC